MGLPLNFVPFKFPQTFVRFSLNVTQMFLSVSWCARPMTTMQSQGHTSKSWDSAAGDIAVLQTAVLYKWFCSGEQKGCQSFLDK